MVAPPLRVDFDYSAAGRDPLHHCDIRNRPRRIQRAVDVLFGQNHLSAGTEFHLVAVLKRLLHLAFESDGSSLLQPDQLKTISHISPPGFPIPPRFRRQGNNITPFCFFSIPFRKFSFIPRGDGEKAAAVAPRIPAGCGKADPPRINSQIRFRSGFARTQAVPVQCRTLSSGCKNSILPFPALPRRDAAHPGELPVEVEFIVKPDRGGNLF